MRIKSVTLYSLPYVVGVVSFLVAAHQAAPTLNLIGLWDTNTKSEILSDQTVNRALKRNRLPIQRVMPYQAPAKSQKKAPIPTEKAVETIIVQRNSRSASLA